jgi:hypothetical protein
MGVGQQQAHGLQDLRDGQRWAPLVLEHVEADAAIVGNVAVIDASPQRDLYM